MKYNKPALFYEDQLKLLIGRGLQCPDPGRTLEWRRRVGYYRLSGYFVPFKIPNTDQFKPTTSWDQIVDLYKFDCALRLLVLQALDRIEVAVRAIITYHLAHELGPFGYTDPAYFDPKYNHARFLQLIQQEEQRSAEVFIKHYRSKYTTATSLPIWMATELVTFGALSMMYSNLTKRVQKKIAQEFGQQQPVFASWLHALTAIRNVCAHHSRLWNRELAIKPELPNAWKTNGVQNDRFYAIALVIQSLLMVVSPKSRWKQRLKEQLNSYPALKIQAMHFPSKWQDETIWVGGNDNSRWQQSTYHIKKAVSVLFGK
jgi:abortive infection bacteriophage resistance protein